MSRSLTLLLALLLAQPVSAAGSRRIALGGEDFAKGELEHLVLDADGALHRSPLAITRHEVEASYLWSMGRDARGRLLLGSGDGGTIFRLEGDEVTRFADTLALEILCLLRDGDRMLAGSSPDGIVYAIGDDGRVEVALDLPQQSIWDLAPARGGFFAAVGPGAKIVRVNERNPAGEVWAELPATNAMRLLAQGDRLWIGTDTPALLQLARDEDAQSLRVLYEAPEQEIRQIVAAGDDAVYVLSLDLLAGSSDDARSRISWINAAGEREDLHVGKERLLAIAAHPDGGLYAADAKARQILHIDRGRKVVLHELAQGDPIALRREPDGELLVGTGNLAALLRLRPGGQAQGRFQSAVIPTPQVAQWGAIEAWPAARSLRLRARSGVRPEVDATWSEWTAAQPLGSVPQLAPAPYVQVAIEFEADAPPLASLQLNYRERNLAPTLSELKVHGAGGRMLRGPAGSSPGPVSQQLEQGLSVEFSVQSPQSEAEAEDAAFARGLRVVQWKSEDANGDRLEHRVEIAPWPGEDWTLLEAQVEQPPFAFDSVAFADGAYRLRVRASDAPDNPLGQAREGEAISAILQFDNTAPEFVSLRLEDGRLRAQLRDAASPLRSIDWRDDGERWQSLPVLDGVLDGREERLDVALPAAHGRIRLRLVDAAGNVRLAEVPGR